MEGTDHFAKGTWKLIRSENFGQYCKYMGVSWVKRLLSSLICPCQKIRVASGHWSILTSSLLRETDVQFTEGKECTWLTYDGRNIRTSVVMENGKLVLHQLDPPFAKITREFDDQTMIMTLEVDGVKARRIYQKRDTAITDNKTINWSGILLFMFVCLSTVSIAWYCQL
ncbi:sodium/calcium exchanger regulatory protein 1-like [Ylistrum balloti]|uniref:sodium/calcium exchanger regulatory protein 1-like n=1 Tax=Ylistrum balloti TaxID=509963 RepID=UPI002905AE5B|nr:sodium/calcium exchanger regulatory protein 1-like [Ylistrum balloti]